MFNGFDPEMIPFFLDLRFHNEKAFMDKNRTRYQQVVREPFYAFIEDLGQRLIVHLPDLEVRPHKCLSRINRDTRFSRDKSPYRDHLWVAFRKAGISKDGMPFYWFEISPEHVNWGVGLWGENRDLMDHMRRDMLRDPERYLRILDRVQESGCVIDGPVWKKMTVPHELPVALSTLYLRRALYAEKPDAPFDRIYSPEIVDDVYSDYLKLMPLYQAMAGFVEE